MKYIAKITVGRFDIGEEVTGLSEKRAKELLDMGAIEQVGEPTSQNVPQGELLQDDEPPQGADDMPQDDVQDEPPQGEPKPKKAKAKTT